MEDDDFEGQLRRARRIRIGVALGLLATIAIVLVLVFRSRDSRTILEREADQSRREAEEARLPEAEYPEARQKLAAVRAELDRVTAPLQILARPIARGTAKCTGVPSAEGATTIEHTIPELVMNAKDGPLEPVALARVRAAIAHTETRLNDKTAERSDTAIRVIPPTGLVLFVIGRGAPATITKSADGVLGGEYTPGFAKGVAVLYSYDQQQIQCVADVDVSNKGSIAVGGMENATDMLWRDLQLAVLAKLADGGVKVP